MKKRLLSTLLMGAFFIASMSMFVSCKDYDDDINANANDIVNLQKQLASLEASLKTAQQDITTINGKFDNYVLKSDYNNGIKALEEKIAKLVTVDALTKAIDDVKKAIQGNSDKTIEQLAQEIAAIDTRVTNLEGWKTTTDQAIKTAQGNIDAQTAAIDELKKALEGKSEDAELNKLFNAVKGNSAAIDVINGKLVALDGMKAQFEELLKGVASSAEVAELRTLMQTVNDKLDKVSPQVNILQAFINKRLTSLVLKPDFYWEGLEGIEVPVLVANAYKFPLSEYHFTYAQDDHQGKVTPVTLFEKPEMMMETPNEPKVITISNGAIATYHMNPSSVSYESLKGAKLSFYTNLAPVYTRAGEDAIFTPWSPVVGAANDKNSVENGLLKVPFKADNKVLGAIFDKYMTSVGSYGEVAQGEFPAFSDTLPFIALQVNVNDTVVTSDYSVVTPAQLKVVALADTAAEWELSKHQFEAKPAAGMHSQPTPVSYDPATHHYATDRFNVGGNHIYRKATDAIVAGATHSILWNEKGLDLKPFIQTHYDYNTVAKYGASKKDQVMTDEQMELLGLHYEFFLVDYLKGDYKTSESLHLKQIGDKTSGVFSPREVSNEVEGGKQLDTQNRNEIGREPLVRVNLVDAEGNVLEYGYIKLRIVEALPEVKKVDMNISEMWMNCGDEGRVNWEDMEHLLFSVVGQNGINKIEFEKNYYLVNDKNNQEMPPSSDDPYNFNYLATRYALVNGEYKAWNTLTAEEVKAAEAEGFTDLGRVWIASKDFDVLDAQTNVLLWNFEPEGVKGPQYGNWKGGMNAKKYAHLMEIAQATYDSKGTSQKVVKTIVHFKKKDTSTLNVSDFYVTLNIPVGKVHFEYGKVANKDWSHWYNWNSPVLGTEDNASPYHTEFDVQASTPAPDKWGQKPLNVYAFVKDLREYWKNNVDLITLEGNKDKFTKFYNEDGTVKTQVGFEFTTPVKGLNSTINADKNGQWVCEGISGTKWTLELGDNNKTIYAVKKNGAAIDPDTVATFLDKEGNVTTKVRYMGLSEEANVHQAATDLLNKMGRYDMWGNKLFEKAADPTKGELKRADFLTNDVDRTFTAYIKIVFSEDPCYSPLIAKNYFNVRFLRPINVWGKNVTWDDAQNKAQETKLSELLVIKDWRDYDVETPGSYANKKVPYAYYGISDLAVIRDEIRTDHDQEPAISTADPVKDVNTILGYTKAKDLSSLTGNDGTRYLKLFSGDGAEVIGDDFSTGLGKLTYVNNSGVVSKYHIYVPIAVKYFWGNIKKEWNNDKNYTQTVWAVITVQSTQGTSTGAKKH